MRNVFFEDLQDVIGFSYFTIEIVSVNFINYVILENMKDQSA